MSEKIKIAVVGVGNCCSALVQGITFYADKREEEAIGLMHWQIGGFKPSDIEVVLAIDVDKRKVGKELSEAVLARPNCTTVFQTDLPRGNTIVQMGRILDGISDHMSHHPEDRTFLPSDREQLNHKQCVQLLRDSGAEILLNYLPVGSEQATRFYAECALEAGVALINNIPVLIASDPAFADEFRKKNIPLIGDDIKAQVGATITHRFLVDLFEKRGVKLNRTYQLNTGGNTDFLNMLNRDRLDTKKKSKTEAIQSVLAKRLDEENIHVGPSDYVPWQNDNKVCFIRMEGQIFGGVPMNLELRLSLEDSPNSAGVVIDAIRCCKLALLRKQGGILAAPSAFFMKHPPFPMSDEEAIRQTEAFILNELEN